MSKYTTPEYLALHAEVRTLVPDNRALCNFTGDCESEMMLAQTLHAGPLNLEKSGLPFSFRGDGCLTGRTQCGTNNARGYAKLLDLGYIEEGEHENKIVLYLTEHGLTAMKLHATRKARP